MRVLIDECLPRKIERGLPGHSCETVPVAGFAGKTNGELLTLAEQAGFEVLLTVDNGMRHQQNFTGRKIAMVVILARSNSLEDLLPHVPACLEALKSIQPGQGIRIS